MTNGDRELPTGWSAVPTIEIASIVRGVSYKKDDAIEKPRVGHLPILRATNIQSDKLVLDDDLVYVPGKYVKSEQVLKPGDIVICMSSGSKHLVGKTAQLDRDWAGSFGTFCGVARFDEAIDQRFAGYFFNSPDYRNFVSRLSSGININNLRHKDIENLAFPVPPLPEQHRIVSKIEELFTQLDSGVARLKRVQAALKRYRAVVLKAACEGRLVPQDPNDEPAEKLLERILAERESHLGISRRGGSRTAPTPLDTDDLPELPEGWCWATWGQIGLSQNGRSFPSEEYQSSGVKLLRPGNLHASGDVKWTTENTRCLPERWAIEYPTFIVGPGELVINLTAQSLKDEFLGRVCMTGLSDRCLLNQRIARLTSILVDQRYLLWMFKSEVFRKFVDGLNTGSLIQHMFTSQLAHFALPLPPLAEQRRIVAEVERRLSVVQELEHTVAANLTRAERLRQAILRRAFEGKLVPQDPNDEPAEKLLERIRQARAQSADGASPKKHTLNGQKAKKKRTKGENLRLL